MKQFVQLLVGKIKKPVMKTLYFLIIISLFFISISCNSDDSKIAPEDEIVKNSCNENTISASTTFGSFCPGFAELGGVDKCDKSLTFFYIFKVNESNNESFTLEFKIQADVNGTFESNDSKISIYNKKLNTWDVENENHQFIPKKTTVIIKEFNKTNISGSFEIEINNVNKIKGYFYKLKLVDWSKKQNRC